MSRLTDYRLHDKPLSVIDDGKILITTLNAHSFNVAKKDSKFAKCLKESDVLLPDGISVVWALSFLKGKKIEKIAGADLFFYEMNRLQEQGGSCFFLGSTEDTLRNIKDRAAKEYPEVDLHTYSPPYKSEFSIKDSATMIQAVNEIQPDALFIGLTAPKQEKWSYQHYDSLNCGHICCIGAVFDFYAGTVSRAPDWMINAGLEWFYRLIREPKRMWRRYLLGNIKFTVSILREKLSS